MTRRTLLAAAGLGAVAGLAGCTASGPGSGTGAPTGNARTLKFTNRLRIPPLAESDVGADGVRRFSLRVEAGNSQLLSGRSTPTVGINGTYLGPTLRAARGEKVEVEVVNEIDEMTTMHWHGMRLPAAMDGGPHQPIEPGATWTPSWTVDQPAATSWYHPHPHGATANQIYRGLAGMFLLDDPESTELGLPNEYGVDDIPVIVQDKNFTSDNALDLATPGWGKTFGILGDHILVNGTYDPYVEVSSSLVRFRVLNASNARMYNLGFDDRRSFEVIGTDAGLLPAPVTVDQIRVSPGERVDIVVAFKPDDEVTLVSAAGPHVIDGGEFDILRITAAARLTPATALPASLGGALIEPVPGPSVREFTLSGSARINSKEMDLGRIDEVVPAGAREIWEIDNVVYAHNFHIHEVAFRVLDVDGEPPPAYLQGPKDTVFVPGGKRVRLAVEFGEYIDAESPYMYHCHILYHEDLGMMGQFVVVEPGTEASISRTIDIGERHH